MAQPLCRASRDFPLAGPAALTARFTLLIFAIANLALIWIKNKDQPPPAGAFTVRAGYRLQAFYPASCFLSPISLCDGRLRQSGSPHASRD